MNANLNPLPAPESSGVLNYFTQFDILRQIGHRRLAKLLKPFDEDLKAARFVLPEPDPENDDYFADLANALSTADRLPSRLQRTLLTIECAASPQNEMPLWRAIQRRLPGVSVSHDCALDRALDLWFLAPEEFAQFIPPNSHVTEPVKAPAEPPLQNSTIPILPFPGAVSPTPQPSPIRVDSCPFVVSPPPDETDQQAFARLARLSPAQYDRVRKAEAKRLDIRIETLDKEVAKARAEADYDDQARAIKLPPVEPWPEPVNGAEVLDQVSERFTLHLVLPPGAADGIALWCPHTHAVNAFLHTPRLNLSSPEAGCGKTTTLDLIATMTPRALRTENINCPVLFRVMDQHQPTLLLDEVDAYLTHSEELRGLLNAGHKQGACAYRCEGGGNAIRAFKAFGPAVLSGIGPLPDTLHDRSIRILLVEAQPGEVTAHLDSRHHEIETTLCRKLARWTQDHFVILQACDPPMPPGAYNRVADNWRPLFAIAHVAGGDWPRRALDAFNHLANCGARRSSISLSSTRGEGRGEEGSNSVTRTQQLDGLAVELLSAIRQIFTQSGVTRLSCKQLVTALQAIERPRSQASTWNPALAARSLGHDLRRIGIRSRCLRIDRQSVKGYALADFSEAFRRFLKP